ncbi:glutamate synthase-related protein [Micromonospora sp. BRA006-A]|nr:glutamate synthase-related protein [Micromonospora sp. BRA006-A]
MPGRKEWRDELGEKSRTRSRRRRRRAGRAGSAATRPRAAPQLPVLGRARYLIESIGPELRQYIVAGNDEERPFTRDQRRWVYASAKQENNYFGFGTDNDIEHTSGYPIIKHRTFGRAVPPSAPTAGHDVTLPCAKVLGAARGRARAFRPESVVNISGMSFGSLSANAVEALNRGAALAGCLQNTGEGGLSPYHRNGGELVFQLGTAYFGCRDEQGRFSLERLKDLVASAPVRALEIKLSQGAKPEPGRPAAGGEGLRRDRRHPGHSGRSGLRQPVPARRVLRLRQPARLGGAARRRDRPAGRHQVRRRRPGVLGGAGHADARHRARRGLRDRRRGRGRHRRRAADLQRLGLAAVPAGLLPGLPHLRRTRPAREGGVRRRRQARPAGQRGGGTSGGRRCWRSAASRRRSATPTPARPGSPRRTRGWPEVWTRHASRYGPRTTSVRYAATWSRWPRRAVSSTPG